MDQKILNTLQAIQKTLTKVVTKNDLRKKQAKYVTKTDIKILATKNDLKHALLNRPTNDDLISFATKNDLDSLELHLHAKIKYEIDNAVIQIGGIVDTHKAERKDVNELDKRVTRIERKLAA
jgi:hypothetical protein